MDRRTERHPLYGEIPLVERSSREPDGHELRWTEYDREFAPKLPPGAVRGDVQRQQYCRLHEVPKYFYVDEENTCVQCGARFTFEAKEQKYWYETLKFNFASVAIRCRACRKKRRSEHALRQQIAAILEHLRAHPRDPHSLLELAMATIEYRERTGEGNLDRAIAACRAAREGSTESTESLFWEARCQQLVGRAVKARACYRAFLDAANGKSHLAKLIRHAEGEMSASQMKGEGRRRERNRIES